MSIHLGPKGVVSTGLTVIGQTPSDISVIASCLPRPMFSLNFLSLVRRLFMPVAVLCASTLSVRSATSPSIENSASPAALPGRGLAEHPFLYTGEWDHRKSNQTIFIVRDGKVAWVHSIPSKDADGVLAELGDATLLSNG